MEQPLSAEALDHLRTLCAAHGLALRTARQRGVLLELVPVTLDHLPAPHQMRELADALGGDGVRYVALALEDTDPTEAEEVSDVG